MGINIKQWFQKYKNQVDEKSNMIQQFITLHWVGYHYRYNQFPTFFSSIGRFGFILCGGDFTADNDKSNSSLRTSLLYLTLKEYFREVGYYILPMKYESLSAKQNHLIPILNKHNVVFINSTVNYIRVEFYIDDDIFNDAQNIDFDYSTQLFLEYCSSMNYATLRYSVYIRDLVKAFSGGSASVKTSSLQSKSGNILKIKYENILPSMMLEVLHHPTDGYSTHMYQYLNDFNTGKYNKDQIHLLIFNLRIVNSSIYKKQQGYVIARLLESNNNVCSPVPTICVEYTDSETRQSTLAHLIGGSYKYINAYDYLLYLYLKQNTTQGKDDSELLLNLIPTENCSDEEVKLILEKNKQEVEFYMSYKDITTAAQIR